ncbi:hypothetical protein IP78_01950 [Brevundimonas sp. AAP58]|uniref:hypothetical protein n=1 Tax=Brevundimonas sp. AAP58 TaxID=1523422 RepID=UPI0006B8A13B|nr:hypothetical protein [Brevundimonas sp. AAP58]KPF83519.1 hypothetical protein IP78_01950 [Brevundimonas sp. AAP58]
MILSTSSGDFPIPPDVASRLPQVPALPEPDEPNYSRRAREFTDWLESSPEHAVRFERLRRWHLVQDELARKAASEGRPFFVTDDGLD